MDYRIQTRLSILVQKLCTPAALIGRSTASVAVFAHAQRGLLTAACILLMHGAGADVILPCCCQNRL